MKTIQRSILISLVPFLTPLAAFAEKEKEKESEVAALDIKAKNEASSWRSSQVIGRTVKNTSEDLVGEVEDLMVDMKEGRILAVIISTGGFLGIADTLSAVPVSALRYDHDAKAFKTELTKAQLAKAPQFKNDAWPDYGDATSLEALRSFRDAIVGDGTEPDNSAQNKEEMENNELTPTNQGSGDKDIQITKAIRAEIMGTELSFNAKNIKIITNHEHVSLKGVVESEEEHRAIVKIARSHANKDKITDDLKVKSN